MQRGWSSFADTRQITFLKTIGEDQQFRHFLAAVCRRRWPSGRRPQAPQRPTDFRKAHRRDNSAGGTGFSGGGRLWSEAEPAGLGGAGIAPHRPSSFRWNKERDFKQSWQFSEILWLDSVLGINYGWDAANNEQPIFRSSYSKFALRISVQALGIGCRRSANAADH